MKTRKIPMRSCVVTREKFPKQELIRIVRTPDNTVIIDESGKCNGRGGRTPDEKIEGIHDEIEEEFGAPSRESR